uniref:Uncharacterized protein n=1 Tax=Octopus bimaculoides TaxID=37653 RepID=A0A0L8HMW3_OCTBM
MSDEDKGLQHRDVRPCEIATIPCITGLAVGFLAKTDKSKDFKHVLKKCADAQLPDPRENFIIEDGNAVFHCLHEIPQTFGEISRKVLRSPLHLLPVIFSTDMYKENSVKGVEQNRRDWKVFLANDENKTQFIQLLLTICRSELSADILIGHEMVLICEGKIYHFISDGHKTFYQEIHSLESSQENTDTHVFLYCMYAKEWGCKSV